MISYWYSQTHQDDMNGSLVDNTSNYIQVTILKLTKLAKQLQDHCSKINRNFQSLYECLALGISRANRAVKGYWAADDMSAKTLIKIIASIIPSESICVFDLTDYSRISRRIKRRIDVEHGQNV